MSVHANLRTGLNPYGLTWTLGLQGAGTPRGKPNAKGLEDYIAIANEIGADVLELHHGWLAGMADRDKAALAERIATLGMTPIIAASLPHEPIEPAFASAMAVGAKIIRLGLTTVLCGDRAATPDWPERVAHVRASLARLAPVAADYGLTLAIENHQDFTSLELVELCEASSHSLGITLDTGNAFPVAEAPLEFARTVASHVRHVHLKDYRVQPTAEGFRLVRCPIGDGAVPIAAILALLLYEGRPLTASLEPGALEARHVRWMRPDWWRGFPAAPAERFAACLAAARLNHLPEDADFRTPWETHAPGAMIETYERAMIARSAANMRALGLMRQPKEPQR